MEVSGWGLVLLLVSVLLSRGVSNVAADMDDPTGCLMGMHGYCTQELVNLLILGALCCVPLLCAILLCAVLCCAVLCCAVLHIGQVKTALATVIKVTLITATRLTAWTP
jgi:hypothetical protein